MKKFECSRFKFIHKMFRNYANAKINTNKDFIEVILRKVYY